MLSSPCHHHLLVSLMIKAMAGGLADDVFLQC